MPRRTVHSGAAKASNDGDDFVIDFSNVEELSDEPLPIGEYFIEVEKATLGKTEDGKRYLQLQARVVEGPNEDTVGRKISDRIYLTADSLWRAKKALRAFGFNVEGALNLTEIVTDIIGKEVDVITKIDTLPLDGRKVSRINRYIPAGEAEEYDEEEEEAF